MVSAANSLDLLQEGLTEDGVDLLKSSQGEQGGDSVLQAGKVGKIHQLLLQALDQARQRLEASRRSDSSEQAEIAQAGEAQALAAELRDALDFARKTKGCPTAIVMNTIKGKGISIAEGKVGSHNMPLSAEETAAALQELA